jgi:exodeoxyribonuclease VII large subunit
MDTALSLYQLNKNIHDTLREGMRESVWVKAEIAQMKENFSGHCYLELVDKDPKSEKLLAQTKANIWANTYRILKPYFETTAGIRLTEGLQILILVRVDFHELYGLSLNIVDIDPAFTVGELALRKLETIKKLRNDGIFNINHELQLPLVPQRIAVISSGSAAGYTDFVSHLTENAFSYVFSLKLFQAAMQGEKAVDSIIEALDQIYNEISNFDVVVIIRGGGSQLDLSCFDSYLLASNVAQFPLPVLTGIGHEQDDSIVDMVAHTRLKTPTAVAGFLIDTVNGFENSIDELGMHAITQIENIIEGHSLYIEKVFMQLPSAVRSRINAENAILDNWAYSVSKQLNKRLQKQYILQERLLKKSSLVLKSFFNNQIHTFEKLQLSTKSIVSNKVNNQYLHLKYLSNTANLIDPKHILKRGFSITLFKGKPLLDGSLVSAEDTVETLLYKGTIHSKVIK